MMIDPLIGLLVWMLGVLLGALFFGGLWWTIRKSLASQYPAVWFIGSLLLRMSVTLFGFYWIADGDWLRLLICLSGFVMARLLINRLVGSAKSLLNTTKEVGHAP
ncbi:ATP synthase subunit I [Methylomonas sp. AM2-LC]|uniref:ATP synthase subunit I n=1 Tax=Methylomonas sp. AM2-LC TaxID=3153301 RepID=UPI0032639BD2